MVKLQYLGNKGPLTLMRKNLVRSYLIEGPGATIDCIDQDAKTLIEENPNMFAVVSIMREPDGFVRPGMPEAPIDAAKNHVGQPSGDPASEDAARAMLKDIPEHNEDEPRVPLTGDGLEGPDDENGQAIGPLGVAELTEKTVPQLAEYVALRQLPVQIGSKDKKQDIIKTIIEAEAALAAAQGNG